MGKEFSFDAERFEKFAGTLHLQELRRRLLSSKRESMFDAAFFIKETLNRIDSSYQA